MPRALNKYHHGQPDMTMDAFEAMATPHFRGPHDGRWDGCDHLVGEAFALQVGHSSMCFFNSCSAARHREVSLLMTSLVMPVLPALPASRLGRHASSRSFSSLMRSPQRITQCP
jgi:hypothetical protein